MSLNTTQKGDLLENKVYDLLSQMIKSEKFIARSECCRLFKKKKYFSSARGKDIIFDVSVEVTFPGEDEYSLLFLYECKNSVRKVPVDDVEEFFAKIGQIGACKIKGVVVSTNAFQESAFEVAKSWGIGLLRYIDSDQTDWVLHRSPSSVATPIVAVSECGNVYQGLRCQGHTTRYFDYYGFADGGYTNSLYQFHSLLMWQGEDEESSCQLARVKNKPPPMDSLVPYIKKENIEELAHELQQSVERMYDALPLDKLCHQVSEKYNIKIKRETSLATGELGRISFNPPEIVIDDDQAGSEQRIRFTIAHELGHFFLDHGAYMKAEVCHEFDMEMDKLPNVDLKDILRMEWQANYFASCLLLPKEALIEAFAIEVKNHDLMNRGHGWLYLDNQPCNLDMFYNVTGPIMQRFNVSRTVVKIRLKDLGLINDVTSTAPSIGACMKEL